MVSVVALAGVLAFALFSVAMISLAFAFHKRDHDIRKSIVASAGRFDPGQQADAVERALNQPAAHATLTRDGQKEAIFRTRKKLGYRAKAPIH